MKDLDWSNLSFGYRQTDYNVRCYYRNGKWGEIEVCSDEYLKLHMAARDGSSGGLYMLPGESSPKRTAQEYFCSDGQAASSPLASGASRFAQSFPAPPSP